jgi:hypothetical protein
MPFKTIHCIFFILIITLIYFESSVAKMNLLSDSENQKKTERKVALKINNVGFGLSDLFVLVKYKEEGKKEYQNLTPFVYPLNEDIHEMITNRLLDRLLSKKFDRILISDKAVQLVTPNNKIKLSGFDIKPFYYLDGEFSDYKTSFQTYLNQNIVDMIKQILTKGLDERNKNLKNKEMNTFMAAESKSAISSYFIDQLMNDIYIFSVYISLIKSNMTIDQKKKKIKIEDKEETIITYKANVHHHFDANVMIYKYNSELQVCEPYHAKTIQVPIILENLSGNDHQTFDHIPTQEESYQIVLSSLKDAFDIIALEKLDYQRQLEWREHATIDETGLFSFKSDIGMLEDLYIDTPYIIKRQIDGEMSEMGFSKARTVANNQEERSKSSFRLIKGEYEIKDLIVEHPWTGNFACTGPGFESFDLNQIHFIQDDKIEDVSFGGILPVLRFSARTDLGYQTNIETMSEWWGELYITGGYGGDKLTINGTDISEMPYLIGINMAMNKRFYLIASGVYVAPSLGLGYRLISANMKNTDGDIDLQTATLNGSLELGYNFSPNIEINCSLGYHYSVWSKLKFDTPEMEVKDHKFNGGINAFAGIAYHFPL